MKSTPLQSTQLCVQRPFTLLILGVFSLGLSLAEAAPSVFEGQLANGMRVLVQEDHRAPIVTSQVWYRVGSGDEPGGMTGISHMLEHMMFKGTKTLPPGKFSEIIAAHGGQENAFTSRDYTAYFQTLAREHLDVAMRLEADRMRNLNLRAEDLAKEAEVVKEERRMRTDDNPNAKLMEQFQATAYLNGGYHHPVIGWMDDINQYDIQKLRAWYQADYAPNNATLVVVGDVKPAAVMQLAEKHFGPLKPFKLKQRDYYDAIAQSGERRISVRAPAKLPILMMGYRVPSLLSASKNPDVAAWEPYALEVLAGVLDGGQSARLSKNLVRGEQIAGEVSVGYSLDSRLSDIFTIYAVPNAQIEPAKLEQAIRNEINKLRETPVSAAELARVKAQVIAADVYGRDSVFYQAMRLGSYEAVGLGHARLNDIIPGIEAITAEQVQAVAKKYLVDDHLTVGVLDPLPMTEAQAKQATTSIQGASHVR
ncbi:MAG: pitrilysin family protein [Halothiobacillaceae bacterium]|nr:pitrilysin family protein [Halothiobacillaceae bacterium]